MQSDIVSVGSSSNFDAVALKTDMYYSVAAKIFIYSLLKFWPQFALQITDAAWSHCVFAKYILYMIFINTRGPFKLQYEIKKH